MSVLKDIGKPMLEIKDLEINFPSMNGYIHAVQGFDLLMEAGDSVAIVGESGSGKSVTTRSILGLIEVPPAKISGSINFFGESIINADESTLRDIRGKEIAMVFQDSLDCLNPVFTVGSQMIENLHIRNKLDKEISKETAIHLMEQVDIQAARNRINDYPHQFSGGMRQRINIAMAISMEPKLLIADEPTTALDVTVQAGILRLIKQLQKDSNMGLIFVTHDLSIAKVIADKLIVMYAGRVLEQGPVKEVFSHPCHPYTKALLFSHPNTVKSWKDLRPIDGKPPEKTEKIPGCCFHPRCPWVKEICRNQAPMMTKLDANHLCRCHFASSY